MNVETGISLAAILFGLLSFGFCLICYKKQRNHRNLLEFAEQQIEDLQDTLAKNKEAFETNSHRVAEHSRRIAWLETRIRQPKSSSEEVLDDTAAIESPKPNITERRHRVITLASRGQNAETIAATLGMLPGEVELIINLNQAALNNK
jgi:septal ring factor EnvC (AmiA/AmiB activator)